MGIDEFPPIICKGHHISCFEGVNDIGQGSGDGIDGEVALTQVLFNSVAFEWSDIYDGFLLLVFDNDAAGFVMEVDIVACKFVGEATC